MNSNKSLVAAASVLAFLGLFVISVTLGQSYVEGKVREEVNQSIAKNADKVQVTYRNVKVSFLRRKVSINGIHITSLVAHPTQLSIDMDRFEISEIDTATLIRLVTGSKRKTIPASVRFGLEGMHFTPEVLGAAVSKSLTELNYSEFKVSMSMGFKIDREAKTVKVDDMNIDVADMAKLSTTWAFSNVEIPTDEELENPEKLKALTDERVLKIKLHYADLRLENHSLLARIDADSKKSGKPSLAQLAQMLGGMAQPREPAKLAFLNDAVPKLQDFLTKGGTIALKAAPSADLTYVQLANPMNLMDPNAFATQIGLSLEVTH